MRYLDAAIKILQDEGQPLHYADIASLARKRRLVDKDEEADPDDLASKLYSSIKRSQKLGEAAPLYLAAPSTFGLSEWEDAQGNLPDPAQLDDVLLTYKQAAVEILAREGRPLHYREITEQALEQDLIRPFGLTPEYTMASQLYEDVKLHDAASQFQKTGGGRFGLAAWEPSVSDIERAVQLQWMETADKLLATLREMEPDVFERLIARLLGAMGYENPVVVGRAGDGGVDVTAEMQVGVHRLRTAVQVKRQARNVQRPIVSQLRGDIALVDDVDHGMVITTSGFSRGAIEAARAPNMTPILLIDGAWLTELLMEHGVGVKAETIKYLRFDEDDLYRAAQ